MDSFGKHKFVFFSFNMYFGGAPRSTCFLCKQLLKTNDVTVLNAFNTSSEYLETLKKNNIPFNVLCPDSKYVFVGSKENLWKRYRRMIFQLWPLIKLRRSLIDHIRKIDPDVIWTTDVKSLFVLATCFSLKKYPVVLYARGWYLRAQLSSFQRWLIRNKTDEILAVSNPTAISLESWGVDKEKISVVFNTIDFEEITKASEQKLVGDIPGAKDSIKILVPGQLLRTKGQHTVIQASDLLCKKGYNFSMWIAGGVAIGDESNYLTYIKNLISERKLDQKVFLLGFRNDIPALIKAADIIVVPTHTEGLPRVILEAMLLKRPIISTPAGGITDLIQQGKTGLIVDVEDVEGFAKNIEQLFVNQDYAKELAENAYKHVCDNFSVDKNIVKVKNAFEKVIRKKM